MSDDDKRREKRCLLSVYPDVSGLVQLAVTKEKRGVCKVCGLLSVHVMTKGK